MVSVIMPSFIGLCVVLLRVIMLSVRMLGVDVLIVIM
jgi:hypothetical protein